MYFPEPGLYNTADNVSLVASSASVRHSRYQTNHWFTSKLPLCGFQHVVIAFSVSHDLRRHAVKPRLVWSPSASDNLNGPGYSSVSIVKDGCSKPQMRQTRFEYRFHIILVLNQSMNLFISPLPDVSRFRCLVMDRSCPWDRKQPASDHSLSFLQSPTVILYIPLLPVGNSAACHLHKRSFDKGSI